MKTLIKSFSVMSVLVITAFLLMDFTSCTKIDKKAGTKAMGDNAKIIFLHHSTGNCIWKGGVPEWISKYNTDNSKNYSIKEQAFPKGKPYGWKNYPYDYWNIWVNNAGMQAYMEEPTLEILTPQYNVIIFKHCFPVAHITEDTGTPDISSESKSIENYKLQYEALKTKLKSFPDNRFIVWTGAALTAGNSDEGEAQRTKEFFSWVKNTWDEKGDNIFVWDFYELETEGTLYLKNEYAEGPTNPHPNDTFSKMAAPYFGQRIIDVIEGRGDSEPAHTKNQRPGR